MPFSLKLAWKYFRSSRKGLARFTAFVAVTGIAAGVASLIIAQALAQGFSDEVSGKILKNTAHISVAENGDAKISNWRIVRQKIENAGGVEKVIPTAEESAVISGAENSGYAVLKVKMTHQDPAPQMVSGKELSDQIEVSLGSELAKRLKLKIGDEAEILALGQNEKPLSATATIAGAFETGLYEYDSTWAYISESDYLKLMDREVFAPTVFNVFVKDIFGVEKTSGEIQRALGKEFKVIDWRAANKPLFAALSLEKKVSFAIILLVIFIAALNITTTLALLVNERKLDIAVLRICGARARTIISIFLFEGMILSLGGIISGTIFGVAGCWIGNHFRLVSLSTEVYSINYVPFNIDLFTILMIGAVTFLIAFGALLFPVLNVIKIKPLENIRVN